MVRVLQALAFTLVLATSLATATTAADFGGTQWEAVFALHAVAHPGPPVHEAPCDVGLPTIPCSNYRVTWPLRSSADVYLVVARAQPGPGIAGISCGILYDPQPQRGVDMFGWTLCADLEFTNAGLNGEWPASGGGNRITWSAVDACQRTVINPDGVHAIAGAFYVYAYSQDTFEVTPNTNLAGPDELAVADCQARATYLWWGGSGAPARVAFGQADPHSPGRYDPHNPCVGWFIPTEPTTWGKLKAKY